MLDGRLFMIITKPEQRVCLYVFPIICMLLASIIIFPGADRLSKGQSAFSIADQFSVYGWQSVSSISPSDIGRAIRSGGFSRSSFLLHPTVPQSLSGHLNPGSVYGLNRFIVYSEILANGSQEASWFLDIPPPFLIFFSST